MDSEKRGTLLTHHIALGGRDDANNMQTGKFGITHILNVAVQMPLFFQENLYT